MPEPYLAGPIFFFSLSGSENLHSNEADAQEEHVPSGGASHYTLTINPSANVRRFNLLLTADLRFSKSTGVTCPAPASFLECPLVVLSLRILWAGYHHEVVFRYCLQIIYAVH